MSLGVVACGVVSFVVDAGVVSLGVVACGVVSFVVDAGVVSLGVVVCGVVSFVVDAGVVSLGVVTCGVVSVLVSSKPKFWYLTSAWVIFCSTISSIVGKVISVILALLSLPVSVLLSPSALESSCPFLSSPCANWFVTLYFDKSTSSVDSKST